MSTTVFDLPVRLLPADSGLLAWLTGQGIDPARVMVAGFRIDRDDDVLTLHYFEFDLDANGRRVLNFTPSGVGDPPKGYARTARSVVVTSLPTLQTSEFA